MGLFDRLAFDAGLDVEFPGFDGDPFDVTWQTKRIQFRPLMDTYRVTDEGRLLKADVAYEVLPEADRPYYDEELGGFERDFEALAGMIHTEHLGWSDVDYHGIFEFHASIDGEHHSFDAKFTDGELVEITAND